MKHLFSWPLAALLILCASTANADSVNLNVHIGDEPQEEVIVVREPAHHHHSREIYVEDDVQFILPGALGFYVAVGLPYDLFYVGKKYYLYRDGYWHRAHHSRGPWIIVSHRDLPPGLRKHKIERLRYYRDEEHEVYRREEANYRGKHFRSNKEEWHEPQREGNWGGKEQRQEENRRHGDQGGARGEQRDFSEFVAARFDEGIPSRVHDRRKQHDHHHCDRQGGLFRNRRALRARKKSNKSAADKRR